MTEKDIDTIRNEWISKDKVWKLLGFFSSLRLQQGWKAAESNPDILKNAEWDYCIERMRQYYKPTENHIIRNFEFRQIMQLPNETFRAFCNRVEAAGKTCTFCNCKKNCVAEEFAIRDQTVIGTINEVICEKAMLKNWNLQELCQNGMKNESAAAGEERISGGVINKISPYKFSNLKRNNNSKTKDEKKKCYRCGVPFKPKHTKECKTINSKCLNCNKIGHFAKVCQQKSVKVVDEKTSEESESENDTYQLNIGKIKVSQNVPKFNVPMKHDFTKHLFINNGVVKILKTTEKMLITRLV